MLNLTQDHLDWHGTMDAYVAAKARVFGEPARDGHQPRRPAGRAARARAVAPSRWPRAAQRARRRAHVVRFGLDAPQHPGDFGLVVENGMAWLVRALEADPTLRRRAGEAEEIHLQRLMPADALRVRGRHNAANALAALALASAIGCPLAPMLHGLREYARRAAPRGSLSPPSAASTPTTTARAPTSAPPSPRSTAWAPTARRRGWS